MEWIDTITDFINLIVNWGDSQGYEREKSLQDYIDKYNQLKTEGLEAKLWQVALQIVSLMVNSQQWEQRFGGVQVSVYTMAITELDKTSEIISKFKEFLFELSIELLADEEFRVRSTIENIIQILVQFDGGDVYTKYKPVLVQTIIDALSKAEQENHFINPGEF